MMVIVMVTALGRASSKKFHAVVQVLQLPHVNAQLLGRCLTKDDGQANGVKFEGVLSGREEL